MMRVVAALFVLAGLLAACSGSNRVEGVIPSWANTPPAHPTMQSTARRNHLESRAPAAESPAKAPAQPQHEEAKKPPPQSPSEE
jgi:hypothetical protein